MVSSFIMLLRTKPNYPILQNVRRISVFNGESLFKRHYPKTEDSRIFIPMQMKIRGIRVTKPKMAITTLLFIYSPVFEALLISSAILVKKLWQKLQPEKKNIIWKKLRKRRKQFTFCGIFISAFFIMYCLNHIVETPITKRKRFIFMNEKLRKCGRVLEEKALAAYENKILPGNHYYYKRTKMIFDKIILANWNIPQIQTKEWRLIIIDQPNIANAMSLPSGNIALFTGLFQICSNDDQLAAVLSHEMAHLILDHFPEYWSRLFVVKSSLCFSTFIFWVVFRKTRAFMFDMIFRIFAVILISLRWSRLTELEADTVGLFICAKSCFDIREVPVLLKKLYWQMDGHPDWLSTHPSCQKRLEHIARIMPIALQFRSESNCSIWTSFRTFSDKFIIFKP